MAGFTTVQSLGSSADVPLRDATARGELPGPRILTSVEPLIGQGEKTSTPEEIRATSGNKKRPAPMSLRFSPSGGLLKGSMTMSQEQLDAACDEAGSSGYVHWCTPSGMRFVRLPLPDAQQWSTVWAHQMMT